MKWLHFLTGLALSAVAAAVGWALAAGVCGWPHGGMDLLRELLRDDALMQLALGLSLLLLVVIFWLSALPLGRRDHFLSFENEGGRVSISVNAINTFLARLQTEFAAVLELSSDLATLRNGRIEVRLDITVRSGAQVQQLSQALQQRVRESMREMLGIEDIAAVKVNVVDIAAAGDNEPPIQPGADWRESV